MLCEYSMVKYEVFGNVVGAECNEALAAAEVLHASVQDKTSILYENVVAFRSTVDQIDSTISNKVSLFICKGPFTSEEFMKMMKYDRSFSNENWRKYFKSFAPSAVREKKEK